MNKQNYIFIDNIAMIALKNQSIICAQIAHYNGAIVRKTWSYNQMQ